HRRAAAAAGPVHRRAVDVVADVVGARAVRREAALLERLRAADVVRRHLHAGDDLGDRPRVAARRNAFEDFLVHHRLLQVRPRVDRGRFAGDGDRLVEVTDFELGVDRGHEGGANRDVGAIDRAEALQLELDVIRTRRQAIETVGTGRIGRLGLYAANQFVARDR